MTDGKVRIDTDLDSSGIENGISKISGILQTGFNFQVFKIAAEQIKNFASSVIDAGASFESAMSQVSAISGATGSDLASLSAKAQEMGASTKFTATEAAEALKYMAMAGWKTSDMLAGLPGVMNLAAASGEDLASVSDIVTDALTAFGLSAADSAHFADVLAKASSSSNTNVGLMGNTFKYVAPIAGSLKYSIEDTALAIGLMANAGIKGEQAGTQLRATLNRLVSPTAESASAMAALGISVTNADGSMKPLMTTLQELRVGFSNLSDAEKAEYASNLAGQEAMSGLLAIVNASDADFYSLSEAINSSDGAAQEMADTMNNNLSGKFTLFKSALEGVKIAIYNEFKKPLKDGITALTEFVSENKKQIAKIVSVFAKGATAALTLGSAIAALWAAMKGVTIVNSVISGIKRLITLCSTGKAGVAAYTAVMKLLGTTMTTTAAETALAGAEMTALNGIVTALGGPIGIAVTAIGLVTACVAALAITCGKTDEALEAEISVLEEYQDASKSANDTLEEGIRSRKESASSIGVENASLSALCDRLTILDGIENKSYSQRQQMKAIVAELNDSIDGLNLIYDEETDSLNMTTDAIYAKIDAYKQQAEAQAYQELYVESIKANIKAEEELSSAQTTRMQIANKLAQAQEAMNNATNHADMVKHANEVNEYSKALEEQDKIIEDLGGTVNKTAQEIVDYENKMAAMADPELIAKLNQMCIDAGIAAEQLPASIAAGINNGAYQVPQSVEELRALISYDNMLKDAQNAGVTIPSNISEGLTNGSIDIFTAYDAIKTYLEDKNVQMTTAAALCGQNMDTNMAEGINSNADQVTGSVDGIKSNVDAKNAQMESNASSTGASYSKNMSSAIAQNSGTVVGAASNTVIQANADAMNQTKGAYDVGDKIGSGIFSGIGDWISSIIERARNLVASAVSAARSEADINSPSRKFRDLVGKPMAEGVAVGIEKNTDLAEKAARELDNHVLKTVDIQSILNIDDKYINSMYEKAQMAVRKMGSILPAGTTEFVSKLSSYADDETSDTENNLVVHVHTHLDAKEVAETTASFTDSAIGRRSKWRERGNAI